MGMGRNAPRISLPPASRAFFAALMRILLDLTLDMDSLGFRESKVFRSWWILGGGGECKYSEKTR